jgi:predicted thioesterase
MNYEAVSGLFFDVHYVVPAEQSAPRLFATLPHGRDSVGRMAEVMATAHLVAVAESICLAQLGRYVDSTRDVIVGTKVDCRHCAVVPPGSRIRLAGWVQQLGEREVTFRVFAQDDDEEICDSAITLTILARDELDRVILRKTRAIARRELVMAA